jgi:hypothetical protein
MKVGLKNEIEQIETTLDVDRTKASSEHSEAMKFGKMISLKMTGLKEI